MLSSSWGLALDLGDEISAASAEALYQEIWLRSDFKEPDFKMGTFLSVPQAAEGKVSVAGQQGKTYTKFERDGIGYPSGWQVPLTFSLSLFGFEDNLPDNQNLHDYLLKMAEQLALCVPYRMAVIGDLGAYYLNAEMLNTDWFDLQQETVLSVILSAKHPFVRQHEGQKFADKLFLYTQADVQQYWTSDDAQTRFLRYKMRMAEEVHAQKQLLDWERPDSN